MKAETRQNLGKFLSRLGSGIAALKGNPGNG
jgi:hypothetical protein